MIQHLEAIEASLDMAKANAEEATRARVKAETVDRQQAAAAAAAAVKKHVFPVVRFCSGLETVLVPETFECSLFHCGVAKRVQMPLRLAWAITVHKSQGQTLDKVSQIHRHSVSPSLCCLHPTSYTHDSTSPSHAAEASPRCLCLVCLPVLLIQSPLHKVSVNLAGCFEKGQAYVAMSRARSFEGLQFKGLNKKVGLIWRV